MTDAPETLVHTHFSALRGQQLDRAQLALRNLALLPPDEVVEGIADAARDPRVIGVIRAKCVDVLAGFPPALAEPALLAILASRRVSLVSVGEALGQVGALDSLKALAQLKPSAGDERAAVTTAIGEIRGRLGVVDEGGLSIVEDSSGGGLTIADEGGNLSLGDDE